MERDLELGAKKRLQSDGCKINLAGLGERLEEFTGQVMALVTEFANQHRDIKPVGSRPVQLQFHAFPVMDGVINRNETQPDHNEKEVIPMTTTQTLQLPSDVILSSNRPRAIDRIAMKAALALPEWSNARIARVDRAWSENTRRHEQQESRWLREADALKLSLRICL